MRSTQNWTDCTVTALRDLTPTVREFEIRPMQGAPRAWEPGAHLQVQVLVGGRAQMRHYSLVGEPDGQCWRIAVKRMDDGRGGSQAMWRLAVGERIVVGDPQNHFPLDLHAPAYLLVAGGIGVTPIVSMAMALARRGRPVRMLLGARTQAELAYLPLLRDTLGDSLHTFVADNGESMDFSAEIAALPPGAHLYTCGPVPMLEAIKLAWAQAGRPRTDLRFETFGSSGRLAAQSFQVNLPDRGLRLTVPADTTLLEALEAAGVDTISDCRRGECGLCVMDVLAVDGEVDHRDVHLSAHEKQASQRICPCVSRAVGTLTLDTGWRPDTPGAARAATPKEVTA